MGNVATAQNGNLVTNYTYNDGNLVTGLVNKIGNEIISSYSYTYSYDGNQTSKTDSVNGLTEYEYDGMGRLSAETFGTDEETGYSYDMRGNRLIKDYSAGQNAFETDYVYNLNNQMEREICESADETVDLSYQYDRNGNMISIVKGVLSDQTEEEAEAELIASGEGIDGLILNEYDLYNRLTKVTEGTDTAEYIYNGNNQRVAKTVNGVTTHYIWDGNNIVMEYTEVSAPDADETNANEIKYICGLSLLAKVDGNGDITRYVYNAHGDVTALVDGDDEVVKEYDYDAFGNERNLDPRDTNPFRYCGEYTDLCSGLIYLRNRYYDPSVGRFISEDPIEDGTNWYIYANNNPIMFFDPLGLAPTPQQAAAMAEHIYNYDMSYSQEKRTVEDWRLITVWEGREGLKMGFYIPSDDDWQNPSEYAIVFKGTTWYDLGDWKNNAEQLLSPKSSDMWDAINYSKGFVNNHSQEITFVGHSKGGAEAASAAVATNKNAMIFNPATSNLSAYGLSSSRYTASMTAYIVKGDILNAAEGWFSKPIDKAVYLPQQHGGHWYEGWQTSLYQSIQNHLMDAVKSALREAGY